MAHNKSNAKMRNQQSEMIPGDNQSNQNQGNFSNDREKASRAGQKGGSK